MATNKRAWISSPASSHRYLGSLMDLSDSKAGHSDVFLMSLACLSPLVHSEDAFWNVASRETGGRLPVLHGRKDRPMIIHWGLLERRGADSLHIDDAGPYDDDAVAAIMAEAKIRPEASEAALDVFLDQAMTIWPDWAMAFIDPDVD
jgi:hypothetical protein